MRLHKGEDDVKRCAALQKEVRARMCVRACARACVQVGACVRACALRACVWVRAY